MKKKFEDAFRASAKDFGLSDKALKELLESGAKTIADDATDEVVKAQVDLFVNIAKAMQGEVTRKVQAAQEQQKENDPNKKDNKSDDSDSHKHDEPDNKGEDNELAKQLKAIQEQLAGLQKANEQAAAEKAEKERLAIVKASAEKAGLGDNILSLLDVSKVKTTEEADTLFAKVKQELVNDKLPRRGAGATSGSSAESDKEAAEAWAKALPDK